MIKEVAKRGEKRSIRNSFLEDGNGLVTVAWIDRSENILRRYATNNAHVDGCKREITIRKTERKFEIPFFEVLI